MNQMSERGYKAVIEFDESAGIFHGTVINTNDVIDFQGTNVDELKEEFRKQINNYLAFCKERGKSPDKPFSGRLHLRLTPELHKRISAVAKTESKSLNTWINETLDEAANESATDA